MARILYFSRDYTVHDQRFLTALAQTDHQVGFLRLENLGLGLGNDLPDPIQDLPWVGGKQPYRAAQQAELLADLQRVIREFKPDLIQAGPLHLSAYLAAQSGFQPLLSLSWGYDLLYEAPRSEAVRQTIRYTLARSAALVGDCQTIRQLAVSFGMPEENIVTFPWGIDLTHFCPRSEHTLAVENVPRWDVDGQEPFVVLSNRGWEPIYGVEVIARAFVQAVRQRPELRLILLGSGSQAGLLRQILEEGGVLDRVVFPGVVDQEKLPDYYRAANLYVSASHSDGTSISLLEALACGTPALVSDIPGNREWIEAGVQGWWFPDGDHEALSRAIIEACDQPQELQSMRQAARSLAEQRADWNKNFLELFKAYQIALSREPSKV